MIPPLVYIAGPFRGKTPLDVRRNVEAARDLGLKVALLGAYPVIPHTMTAEFDKQGEDQFWLDGTMELLRRCDAIVFLNTWRNSSGATAEIAWAAKHMMPGHEYAEEGSIDAPDKELALFIRFLLTFTPDRLELERAKRTA